MFRFIVIRYCKLYFSTSQTLFFARAMPFRHVVDFVSSTIPKLETEGRCYTPRPGTSRLWQQTSTACKVAMNSTCFCRHASSPDVHNKHRGLTWRRYKQPVCRRLAGLARLNAKVTGMYGISKHRLRAEIGRRWAADTAENSERGLSIYLAELSISCRASEPRPRSPS